MANLINIFAPRWKDRTILIADWKIGKDNDIDITATKKDGTRYFPEVFHATGEWLQAYPLEDKPNGKMRIVPLQALFELKLDQDIMKGIQ